MLSVPQMTLPSACEVHENQDLSGAQERSEKKLLSYAEILRFLDGLEQVGGEEKYTSGQIEKINAFLFLLAREGRLPDEAAGEAATELENDLKALLEEPAFSYADCTLDQTAGLLTVLNGSNGEAVLCKSWAKKQWRQTKRFVKKHKKALIIGAAVVAAVTVVAYLAVSAAAAGTAASLAPASEPKTKTNKAPSSSVEPKTNNPNSSLAEENRLVQKPSLLAPAETLLSATINSQIEIFKASAVQERLFSDSRTIASEPVFQETARNFGAFLAHEAFDGVAEIAGILPQFQEEVKNLGGKILPQSLLPKHLPKSAPLENYRSLIADGHRKIDQVFASDLAGRYSSEVKAFEDKLFVTGLSPFPGNFNRTVKINRLRKLIQTGKNSFVAARELDFAPREILQMKQQGVLNRTVAATFERISQDQALFDSMVRYKAAENFLKPYGGKYLPEIVIRKLIHKAGIRTFPRPAGVPENYRVKLSNDGAGIKYVHPKNEGTYVRVMPGKIHSPHPCQRNPYINQRIDGMSLDNFGNIVSNKSPEAHIPINEFIYKEGV
jgi:hypothetical protein